MTSPFRTNPSLGPQLFQVTGPTAGVWYDTNNRVSPKVGDVSQGDDGHRYVFVKASATIAAASSPGTQVVVTEPAMTAATGTGGYYAPIVGVASGDFFWARNGTL